MFRRCTNLVAISIAASAVIAGPASASPLTPNDASPAEDFAIASAPARANALSACASLNDRTSCGSRLLGLESLLARRALAIKNTEFDEYSFDSIEPVKFATASAARLLTLQSEDLNIAPSDSARGLSRAASLQARIREAPEVPAPPAAILFLAGLAGAALVRRRRKA